MTAARAIVGPRFEFDNSFTRDLSGLFQPWSAAGAPDPRLLLVNADLAVELGLDPAQLGTPSGVAALVGNVVPPGAEPVAQAYAGHQFGNYSPRLGDGRALLVGELHDRHGRRRDLHLKGSGRTPFARGGDGYAAVGPMLREYVIGEAMHALGIPTTRALAVVATGAPVVRDTVLPGAVLARIAASHLRVGTFQYAAAQADPTLLRRLADHVLARHHPAAALAENRYLALLHAVVDVQASLVAQWMLVGFVHGVMNTDNMTVSGETIDYGPCAFIDEYDPGTVFSSIDQQGRYAFGNQPQIALWNLARFAESLLPLIAEDPQAAVEPATEVLNTFLPRLREVWAVGMSAKIGLPERTADGDGLVEELLNLLHQRRVDHTMALRSLSTAVRGDLGPIRGLFAQPAAFDGWASRWLERVSIDGRDLAAVAAAMDRLNPVYIPRNHMVEAALTAATTGDMAPCERLLTVLAHPFDERPGLEPYTTPAPSGSAPYRTFCGT